MSIEVKVVQGITVFFVPELGHEKPKEASFITVKEVTFPVMFPREDEKVEDAIIKSIS